MSIAKVLELITEGSTIEECMENAVKEASKTVNNIQSVWLQDAKAVVKNQEVTKYRTIVKVTFLVGGGS